MILKNKFLTMKKNKLLSLKNINRLTVASINDSPTMFTVGTGAFEKCVILFMVKYHYDAG